jgi:hypothetical protein
MYVNQERLGSRVEHIFRKVGTVVTYRLLFNSYNSEKRRLLVLEINYAIHILCISLEL